MTEKRTPPRYDDGPRPLHAWFMPLLLSVIVFIVGSLPWMIPMYFEGYTGVVNAALKYESSMELSEAEFTALVDELAYEANRQQAERVITGERDPYARDARIRMLLRTRSFLARQQFPHIIYFQEAGIRRYEGPSTCLRCHETMRVRGGDGEVYTVDTMDDVLDSVHFKFQRTAPGFTTYGYDGREVNAKGSRPIPVGKIDRACGIPGTFSWIGWATLVKSSPAPGHGDHASVDKDGKVLRSEGCGQCHIGGNYHPSTEDMVPMAEVPDTAKHGLDCLICHSRTYDMNFRHVIEDENGTRWNQDRTMRAALTVGLPTRDNCLFCHQHNMGGDFFAENVAAQNLGHKNQRFLHAGAKRANPFSPSTDVHAAAGMTCLDCHVPEGHKIPRGTKGTDLVANDLPGKEVACENCHTEAPHLTSKNRALLNGHVARIACETCHITKLQDYNVVLRDWLLPVYEEEQGVYAYSDILHSGEPGSGFTFLWFNGYGTFLANALGDHPEGGGRYNPFMNQLAKITNPTAVTEIRRQAEKLKEEHYPDLDVDEYVADATDFLRKMPPELLAKRKKMVEEKIRPLMGKGKSKLYPFKLFNARMYEDMSNRGPFGAMILPFEYATYYETGDTLNAMKTAIDHPIVRRMYQLPFKAYMMDEFMAYFGVDRWDTTHPLGPDGEVRNVESHWMRQMGSLMINHGIERNGRQCADCHSEDGILDFIALGYTEDRAYELENLSSVLGGDGGRRDRRR